MKRNVISFVNILQTYIFLPQKTYVNRARYVAAAPGNCGLGCVAMVLDNTISVQQLASRYKKQPYYIEPVGWSHHGLLSIIENYGIKAKHRHFLLLSSLVKLLSQGKTIIISVRVPKIDNLHDFKLYEKKNLAVSNEGHLCLLVGFSKEGFIIHDPRNIGVYTNNLVVPFISFAKIFTGNGIVIG